MEVSGSDGNKVNWREVDDNFVEETEGYDEITLWGVFILIFLT